MKKIIEHYPGSKKEFFLKLNKALKNFDLEPISLNTLYSYAGKKEKQPNSCLVWLAAQLIEKKVTFFENN